MTRIMEETGELLPITGPGDTIPGGFPLNRGNMSIIRRHAVQTAADLPCAPRPGFALVIAMAGPEDGGDRRRARREATGCRHAATSSLGSQRRAAIRLGLRDRTRAGGR